MGHSQPQTRLAVVRLPAEIDGTNAREEGRDLAAVVPGVTAVIADMTATTFCDSSGVQMLALVHEQAVANQAKLVLVVPSSRFTPTTMLAKLLSSITLSTLAGLPPQDGSSHSALRPIWTCRSTRRRRNVLLCVKCST